MKFKLIIVLTQDELTEKAIEAARAKGATGSTVITSARGEGLNPKKTFMGLTLAGQRDMVLFLVEEHHAREILETIAEACGFEETHGAGVAFMIDIEDAVGLTAQIRSIQEDISKEEL
jgi:nitrogen regulatory protein PII